MGVINFLKKSVSDLFIARPEAAARSLVWRYPDQSIPRNAKLTVRADEVAVFFKEGRLVGELLPGTHTLDSSNLPFLGDLLVSPFTGDNHFITELFFVRKADHIHQTGPITLGQFVDAASRNVVAVRFVARFVVKVQDAPRVLVNLTGLQNDAAATLAEFIDARVSSLMGAIVGRLAESMPILQIVSNQYSEQIGQEALRGARESFQADGVELARFLELHLALDSRSEAALQEFGRKMADLRVQSEGAEVARQPGYAQFQLLQGQRALLEGMAQGAASGNATMLLGGGMGLPFAGLPSGGGMGVNMLPSASTQRPQRQLARTWYLRTQTGIEGPYSVRQLVLRAESSSMTPDTVMVRRQGEDDWYTADETDEIAAEFGRRSRGGLAEARAIPAKAPSATEMFEKTLLMALSDGILTQDEMDLLIPLATASGVAATPEKAREYLLFRAGAVGCQVAGSPPSAADFKPAPAPPPLQLAPPQPPPLRLGSVYCYSNGIEQHQGLTAQAVAARIRATPDGVHMVWTAGMADWLSALEVAEIDALIPKS